MDMERTEILPCRQGLDFGDPLLGGLHGVFRSSLYQFGCLYKRRKAFRRLES